MSFIERSKQFVGVFRSERYICSINLTNFKMDYIWTPRRTGTHLLTAIFFLVGCSSWAQSLKQLEEIQSYNNEKELHSLIQAFEKDYGLKQRKMTSTGKGKQWQTIRKESEGVSVAINDIGEDGTLLYYATYMDPTSKVSRADALYTGGALDLGLSGRGLKVGIWDAGVALNTHQEYGARVINVDGSAIDNHAALVTGTVVSKGIKRKAQGVAFEAEALTHDWSRDKIEVAKAAVEGLLLSNHSYGIKTDRVPDWYFGAYIKVSQDWDKIMYNAPYYLMVTAAGNARNSFDNELPVFGKTRDGFDLLLGFGTSKNGLVVAGADTKVNGQGLLTAAEVSGYSSYGPTDDGRIKPDIAGDGTTIYSTSASSATSYKSSLGTSMAAPGITGALLLLQEYHQDLYDAFMRAATLKGLALHTADDVKEKGPDYKMGWGVINTKKAAKVIRNKAFSSIIEETKLLPGETFSITVKANEIEPFSASISWTDPEGQTVNRGTLNASTTALVNDLDIRVSRNGETYFPWKLNPVHAASPAVLGDNQVDPFERVDIVDARGEYTITISHKGELFTGAQDFSLIVTGVELTDCKLEAPTGMQLKSSNEEETGVVWSGTSSETLYEVEYKKETTPNWSTLTTWEPSAQLKGLQKGEAYQVRVRAVCSQNLVSDFSTALHFVFNGADTVESVEEMIPTNTTLSLRLSPNPVANELEIDAEMTTDAQYTIITTSGNRIRSGDAHSKIQVSDLAAGLYILVVQDYTGIRSTKFVKS